MSELETLRRRLERERKARNEAERIVEQSSAEYFALVQRLEAVVAELDEARVAAEAGARAKADFLASMSHEIRTPMNAIIGMTSLLLDAELGEQEREFVETIRSSGEHLLQLINDILDFSKIEADRLVLEETSFDVQVCVERAVELVAGGAAAKGIELASLLDPSVPPWLVGDVWRIRQILVNLLSNAVKFTEHGEVVLEGSAAPRDDGRFDVTFSVRDTGIGIEPARAEALFEPFTQADTSTTRTHGGTGLGLAISARLVRLMGGDLGVDSTPGAGSTFWFRVPLSEGTPATRRPALSTAGLAGARTLVVDDNATNRRILVLQTERWGMEPVAYASPGDALRAVDEGRTFDIALLDFHMPGMDGGMLAHALRERVPEMPIVLLSSLGWQRDELRHAHLFHAILTKPVKQSHLYEAIVEGLGVGSAQERQAERTPLDHEMATRSPLRILQVEDNPVNQRVQHLLISRLGYRPAVAGNGVEAIEAVLRQPFDVILMDVNMPEMDGYEATRRIREMDLDPRPRIIGLTAHVMEEDRVRCFDAGMDDFLGKPLDPGELAAALARAARGEPAPDAPAPGPERAQSLDMAVLSTLEESIGGPDVLRPVLQMFLEEGPARLEAIRGSVTGADPEALARAAHTLKSTSRMFGAIALSEECLKLEELGRAGTMDGAVELLGAVEALAERSFRELRASRGL